MNFFFQPTLTSKDAEIILNPEESHHAAKVLRCRIGEQASVLNGSGLKALAVFKTIDQKQSTLEVIDFHFETSNSSPIFIAIANLKNRDRLEWFVEKAVELGAAGITVFFSSRTEKHGIDTKRLDRIAISALKQSGNLWLPFIKTGEKYVDVVRDSKSLFIAHCSDKYPAELLKNVYQRGKESTILIGPEGDFTDEEIESAVRAGATPVSLGPFRLRAETAALAALTTVQVVNM
jgi:16S rRNA (uracil1498-N3)-methyltransferase